MGGGDDGGGAGERRTKMAAVARSLEQEFEGHAFALLVFDKDPRDGRVSYVSNRGRGDMLEAMRRLVAAHGGAGAALSAADREALADLARRAVARPVDPRLLTHPVEGPEARRALASLRVDVAGLAVAFSLELAPPAGEPVRHLSVGAARGAVPDPALLRAIAREFGMEDCRFEPPLPNSGEALHAFRPLREGAAAVAVAADAPAARPRWTH